eukprot:2642574-Alexandrium_andersonii.AAC.1
MLSACLGPGPSARRTCALARRGLPAPAAASAAAPPRHARGAPPPRATRALRGARSVSPPEASTRRRPPVLRERW